MTRSYTPRRSRPVSVSIRRLRDPSITTLGFTMFHFEGEWPVIVMNSRNAMSALLSL